MRPKVVILTMLVAFGLLGAVALMKGLGKHDSNSGEQANGSATTDSVSNKASSAVTGGTPVASDQLRAALISKDLEQIQELQGEVDGTNNAVIIAALLTKLSNPESEVRKAAIEAFRQINDTNAIPGLDQAAAAISDPREKVAVLDAIDYLKLPNITADIPADYTNTPSEALGTESNLPTITPNMFKMNPKFSHKATRHQAPLNQQTPQSVPANQAP